MATFKNNGTGGGDRKTFLNFSNGKVVQEWKDKPKDEWVPQGYELKTRIISKGVNQGKERYYVEYDGVSGEILDIALEKTDNGNRIVFTIVDDGQTYIIQTDMDSAYGESVLMCMNNIDLTKDITFQPWLMNSEEWLKLTGKSIKGTKSGLTIRQGGEKVAKFYTKEVPNGLPPMVQKTVKGETKWNSDDRDNFLYDEFLKFVDKAKTVLAGKPTSVTAPKQVLDTVAAEEAPDLGISPDDLPF